MADRPRDLPPGVWNQVARALHPVDAASLGRVSRSSRNAGRIGRSRGNAAAARIAGAWRRWQPRRQQVLGMSEGIRRLVRVFAREVAHAKSAPRGKREWEEWAKGRVAALDRRGFYAWCSPVDRTFHGEGDSDIYPGWDAWVEIRIGRMSTLSIRPNWYNPYTIFMTPTTPPYARSVSLVSGAADGANGNDDNVVAMAAATLEWRKAFGPGFRAPRVT